MNDPNRCPHCHALIRTGYRFCRGCGHDIVDGSLPEEHTVKIVVSRKSKMAPIFSVAVMFLFVFVIGVLPNIMYDTPRLRARQKACMANMRVLEGAIDIWWMDNPEKKFPSCELTAESPLAGLLVPDCIKKIPKCRCEGRYWYRSATHTVSCSFHGTVDKPRLEPDD